MIASTASSYDERSALYQHVTGRWRYSDPMAAGLPAPGHVHDEVCPIATESAWSANGPLSVAPFSLAELRDRSEAGTPRNGTGWLHLDLYERGSKAITAGDPPEKETRLEFVVKIAIPPGRGSSLAEKYAEAIARILHLGFFLAISPDHYLRAEAVETLRPTYLGDKDGWSWYQATYTLTRYWS